MSMFRNLLLLIIELVVVTVEWSMSCIVRLRDYGVRVWKNNAMRKWVLEALDNSVAQFRRVVLYLEEIEMYLQCRIAYAKITKPMKYQYREISRNRIS
jgi:hypothetical protein